MLIVIGVDKSANQAPTPFPSSEFQQVTFSTSVKLMPNLRFGFHQSIYALLTLRI